MTAKSCLTLTLLTTLLVGTALAATKTPASVKPHPFVASPYDAAFSSVHAKNYYLVRWGVDSMTAKAVPSDQLIRFSYRVLDDAKAKPLNAKEAAPQLIDEKSHVSLVVPTMDKVGQLRQSGIAEAGKTYWMVFSNRGNVVKRGSRVSVVIGDFRVSGLPVE